jgi:hypothetical protein
MENYLSISQPCLKHFDDWFLLGVFKAEQEADVVLPISIVWSLAAERYFCILIPTTWLA